MKPRRRMAIPILALAAAGACSSGGGSARDASGTGGTGGAAGAGGGAGSDAGGGGGGGASMGDAASERPAADAAAALALTSPAFAEGGMIPAANTCAGADTSPALAWTGGPAASSYALVLTDVTSMLVHWVVWDIPPGTHDLGAMLAGDAMLASPAGAKQVHLSGAGNGYYGPCPQSGQLHSYQFELHAIKVATLPGVATDSASAVVRAQVIASSLAHADLMASVTGQP